jgi:hypothetical protein
MNKKAHTFMIGIMFGVMGFILTLAFTGALKESISQARTDMTCSLLTLSAGEVAVCIMTDWSFPIFVGIMLGVSFAWLTSRIKLGEIKLP